MQNIKTLNRMENYSIIDIEKRFKETTGIASNIDISYYPITEHIGFEIRMQEKKENGEVFTPLELVDRMLEISKPEPDKFKITQTQWKILKQQNL